MTKRTSQDGVPEGFKRCSWCNEVKPRSEFGPRKTYDGLREHCQACHRADMKARRIADPEGSRQKKREYVRKNAGRLAEKRKAWFASNREKRAAYERQRVQRAEEQIKIRARKWVWNNTHRGKLPKANTLLCEHCGAQAEEYHHMDYNKPTEVTPLCMACHGQMHQRK